MLTAFLTRIGLVSSPRERASDVPRFVELVREHAPALQRLTIGYEASRSVRQELQQEILVALWQALPGFEGRSSLKTWVFRIAHNVSATHSLRARRRPKTTWRGLDELEELASFSSGETAALSAIQIEELARVVRELRSLDRQLVLLFLEGFSPKEIAEVTGLSETNISTKLSRLRTLLRGHLDRGDSHE